MRNVVYAARGRRTRAGVEWEDDGYGLDLGREYAVPLGLGSAAQLRGRCNVCYPMCHLTGSLEARPMQDELSR